MAQVHDFPITHLLLVESCEAGTEIVRRTLHRTEIRLRLHRVGSAAEAIAYLRRTGPYRDVPQPHVLLIGKHVPVGPLIEIVSALVSDDRVPRIKMLHISDGDRRTTLDLPSMYRRVVQTISIDSLAGAVYRAAAAVQQNGFGGT